MPDEFKLLTEISAERSAYFRPAWFKALLTGRLGLGDTYWIGNYGTALVFVPAILLTMISGKALLGDRVLLAVLLGYFGFLSLYFLALTRAVFLCARRTPQVGGWRWAGVLLTLLNAVTTAFLFMIFLRGAL